MPRASSSSSTETVSSLEVGDKVLVSGVKSGTLRYKGTTDFAQGIWAGVQLDEPQGKNDGAVAGKRYFQCLPKYGLFAPVSKVQKIALAAASISSNAVTAGTKKSISQTAAPAVVDTASKLSAMKTHMTAKTVASVLDLDETVIVRSESSGGPQKVEGENPLTSGKADKAVDSDNKSVLVELQSQLKYAEEQRALLQHQLELEKRNSEDLQFRLEEENVTRVEHEEAQQQLSAKTIRKLEIDLQQAIAASTRAEQELAKARSEIASQHNVITDLEARVQDTVLKSEVTRLEELLQEERQTQTNALEAKDLELADLKVSVEMMNQELAKQTLAAKEMKDEVSMLQHQLKETNSQLEAATGSVATDQQVLNQLRADIVAKDVCITLQLQRIDELTKEVASQEQLKQQLSVAVHSSEELTATKEEIVEIRSRLDAEKSEAEELRKSVDMLRQEKDSATDRCGSVELELKESQSKLVFENERTCRLQEDVDSLTKTLEDAQLELKLSQEKNERYTEDKTNLETRISELLKSSDSSSGQVALLDSELKERNRKLDEMRNAMADCEGKLHTAEKELGLVKDQYNSAQATVADLNIRIDSESQSKEELVSQLKAAQEETEREGLLLKVAQSELEETKSAGLTTASELASANQRIAELTENESKMKSRLQDLEHLVRDHEIAVSFARTETESRAATETELRTELAKKCNELIEKEAEIQLAGTQLKDSECSLQSVKDSRSELESRVLELQTLVKEQEADVAVERSKNAELDRRHSQLEIEKNELLEQYNINSNSLKDVETRLAAQSEEVAILNTEITSYNKQVEDLTLQLKSSQDSVEFLSTDKGRLEQEMNELLRTSGDSSKRMVYLEEQVKEKSQELEKLQVSGRETQSKLESVEKQLTAAKVEITAEQERSRTLESDLRLKSTLSDSVKGEAESAQQQIQTLTEHQSHLEENLRKVQALLDKEQAAQLSLQAEKDSSFKMTQELEQKLDEKSQQLQATDKEWQLSAKKLNEVTQELEDAIKTKAELIEKTATLEEAVNRLEEEVKRQIKHVADIEEDKKQLESELSDNIRKAELVSSNVMALQSELQEKESILTTVRQASADLQQKVDNLQAEVESVKDLNTKGLESMKKKCDNDVMLLDEQLQSRVIELQKTQEELAKVRSVFEETKTGMLVLQQQRASATEESVRVQQEKNEAERIKESTLGELRQSLQEKQEAVEKCEALVLERDAVARERDKVMSDSSAFGEMIRTLTAAKESLIGDVKSKEEECGILVEQISELAKELEQTTQLADGRLEAITALESQQTDFENRISLLSDALANAENAAAKPLTATFLDMSNMAGADEMLIARVEEMKVQLAEVQIENESLHNQVEFLNTVIVDLQRKNNIAEKRLIAMEQGIVLDESDLQLMEDIGDDFSLSAPPERLFCDICDVFDEHDTEDCPQQTMEDTIESSHHGQRGEERPYCDNCEEFGHWTEDCNDNETF